ncbi:MAG: hypothetical protein SFV15_16075 [Polyangiaceae bacterium]|nr:hypothetical protein [Polyangiaceae bacterium]
MSMHQPIRGRLIALSLLLLFCAAPTPGDIGACGQNPAPLDAGRFFAKKQAVDCSKCQTCKLRTDACVSACSGALSEEVFPVGCEPLIHDGQVCLHALEAASCGAYARYMRDLLPEVPTECAFCPLE